MEKKESPFFTRFLEDQAFPTIRSDVKAGPRPGGGGGPPVVTLKFPSDDDDDPIVVGS